MQEVGEHVPQVFRNQLTKDIRDIYQGNDFNKLIVMTEEDKKTFEEATKCFICDQAPEEDKMRDHHNGQTQ